MNVFRVASCPEDFPDLDFPGNYPSDGKISGNRPLIIFDPACNAFNFVCLTQLEREIIWVGKLTYAPPSNVHPRAPQDWVKQILPSSTDAWTACWWQQRWQDTGERGDTWSGWRSDTKVGTGTFQLSYLVLQIFIQFNSLLLTSFKVKTFKVTNKECTIMNVCYGHAC